MINLLLCGNKKVFDGALTELISITNRTKESINCYIFTMDASRIKPEYVPIENKQIDFLNKVIQKKNKENKVTKVDVTNLYEQEFLNCKNESAYCTPYTLLRLLADMVPNIPDKLLYLDIDMMIGDDLSKLYNIDVSEYEYAAVKEKYGSIFIRPDYINAGMLLMNMKKIKETKLLEKARNLIKSKKMLFADQDAIFRSTSKKMLIPRKYNEQSKFNRKDTVVCHFCKRMLWFPYPHTENYKQWNVEQVHTVLKCHAFDEDLEEYLKLKKEYEKVTSYLTDIQRIDMQHELLMAVASQMISLKNIPNLTEVISIVSDNMETSLTAENMLYYAKEFLKLDSENIKFYTMPGDTGGNVFGASYVFCDIDAWLDMVNECLNPWEAQVTTENVNIVTYKDGNFYSTTGELSGGVSSFLNYSSSSTMGMANVYTYTSSPSTTNSGRKDDNE